MDQRGQLCAMIDLLYEAALDPTQYQTFLERLSAAVHAPRTMLMAHDTRAWRSSIARSVGIDPASLTRMNSYLPQNPFIARTRSLMRTGSVIVSPMIISDSELIRTEYYNDYLRPYNLHYMVGATIVRDQHGAALITSLRSKERGPFDASEMRVFKVLDPHLRRALQLQKKLDLLEGQRETLDRIPIGCALLGHDGRVLVANRYAEQIFDRKDAFVYLKGQLNAIAPKIGTDLRALVRAVTAHQEFPHPGGVIAVPTTSGEAFYSVLVAPLPKRTFDWGVSAPTAIIFITSPMAPGCTSSLLEQLYGLTPAEARLAWALIEGHGLQRAAEKLGISANTGKTQLQSIFAKTHTSRQAELIRLLTDTLLLKQA